MLGEHFPEASRGSDALRYPRWLLPSSSPDLTVVDVYRIGTGCSGRTFLANPACLWEFSLARAVPGWRPFSVVPYPLHATHSFALWGRVVSREVSPEVMYVMILAYHNLTSNS